MVCLKDDEANHGHEPVLRTLPISTTLFRFLSLAGIGLLVWLFFLFDSTHDIAKTPLKVDLISNEEYLRCAPTVPLGSSLHCAFDNETLLWLCVDQIKPQVLSELHEANKLTLSSMTDFCGSLSYQSVYCTEERGELKCSCVFQPPLQKALHDHVCTRTAKRNWVCLGTAQNITFGNTTLLASALPKTLPTNHTMSCLLSPSTHQWQCGDILHCVKHDAQEMSCWGGGARAIDDASLELFDTMLSVHNDYSAADGGSNATELTCQFNAQKDICKCATLEPRPTTYQCAVKDKKWLCLRGHDLQSFDSLQHLTACVQSGPRPTTPHVSPNDPTPPHSPRQLRTCDYHTPHTGRALQDSSPPAPAPAPEYIPPPESQHSKVHRAHNKQRHGPRISLYDHHESLNLLEALISRPQQRKLRVPAKILKLIDQVS